MARESRRRAPYPARVPGFIESWSRAKFVVTAALSLGGTALWSLSQPWVLWSWIVLAPLALLGLADMLQKRQTIRRNFPLLGHLRYVLESIRPEIRQYFIESDSEETPISREKRSIVYQRAKDSLDTLPFGTRRDVYRAGYEWINHSLAPVEPPEDALQVKIGRKTCPRPYGSSLLNISAMSFGALSKHAILALNRGAQMGGFSHNTGEGGISPFHLEHGGDLVWQIGTGYFGCRTAAGKFCPDTFQDQARLEAVRMIEIKLSQGAKPGHGGVLPGAKVSAEIAEIRGVPVGETVVSPPAHSAFGSPREMMQFIAELRSLSAGKPVGLKLCLGDPGEFLALCRAMLETGEGPDFITVDGAEGGTGAAPLEFSNSVGTPLRDGLTFIHSALLGAGLRDEIRLIAAAKITTGFHIITNLALGADLTNSARGMMFALGCIQALKCHTNRCPTGVTTQDPKLGAGLDIGDKAVRVRNFQQKTCEAVRDLLGAAGLRRPEDLRPTHICRRGADGRVRSLAELYPTLEPGALLRGEAPAELSALWDQASPEHF